MAALWEAADLPNHRPAIRDSDLMISVAVRWKESFHRLGGIHLR
jgi:hypothetical protein